MSEPLRSAAPDEGTPDEAAQPWRVKPVLPVTKLLGAVAVPVLVWAFGRYDPIQWGMAAAVSLGLLAWAARDLIVPVRLAADPDGVRLVTGYAGRRSVAWHQIEAIRLDERTRMGTRNVLVEIDTGDDLYLFSVHDLGADPEAVHRQLEELRRPS